MPSISYRRWRTTRARALDEIAEAHAAVGGSARGRRYTTQQINRAYAVLLAAQFQGFCRDLHSECIDHLLSVIAPPAALYSLVQREFIRGRQLDRGNAQPNSLAYDFRRLDIQIWDVLGRVDRAAGSWRDDLEELNEWRNAIAHQDFTSAKLGGIINLRLSRVKRWRTSCNRLARAMDEVARQEMMRLTGASPW